jgi:4-hydroxy 2-oxovalerate aldolase
MKILDCTLRDGGYYTNWDFDQHLVDDYFRSLNQLPIDYIEIGYRSKPMKEYLGEYFYCPMYVIDKIKKICDKKLVIILNEKDVTKDQLPDLLGPLRGKVAMVRMAIDPKNFQRALVLAEEVKKMGFEVGFNVMYMSNWGSHKDFIQQLKFMDGITDYFYMVDSFGGVYPADVVNTIQMVREQTNVALGFHGHNNMELALINSLTAIEHGVEMIDSTITGMGRGAGNLKTELLLTVLNSQQKLELDFNPLSVVVDGFTNLKKQHLWGTNLPYMFSGANSLPQKEVMAWVSNRFYSFNSILQALENQKNKIEDNRRFELFEPQKQYKKCILIGGGPSAVTFSEPIKMLLEKDASDYCIVHASSRNASQYKDLKVDQYFCLVGNEGNRMVKVFEDLGKFSGMCVLPPYPRKMGTFVPKEVEAKSYELKQIAYTDKVKDSQTALALQICFDLKVEEVMVVGYDGYTGSAMGSKEQELLAENDMLFQAAKDFGLNVVALSPTKYKSLSTDSIFSKFL